MTAPNKPKVSGLVVAPNGAQMWLSHDEPLHVTVYADEPYARVYINGVCITPPQGREFEGWLGDVAVYDMPLSPSEISSVVRGPA